MGQKESTDERKREPQLNLRAGVVSRLERDGESPGACRARPESPVRVERSGIENELPEILGRNYNAFRSFFLTLSFNDDLGWEWRFLSMKNSSWWVERHLWILVPPPAFP